MEDEQDLVRKASEFCLFYLHILEEQNLVIYFEPTMQNPSNKEDHMFSKITFYKHLNIPFKQPLISIQLLQSVHFNALTYY